MFCARFPARKSTLGRGAFWAGARHTRTQLVAHDAARRCVTT
jgi:hypothetical protein